MERVIKFRCWDEKVKAFISIDKIGCNSLNDLTDKYHVMQFTGLIDINGIEKYEGDIVEYAGDLFIIVFQDYGWMYAKIFKGSISMGIPQTHWRATWNNNSHYKVVGNIHKTPELLSTDKTKTV